MVLNRTVALVEHLSARRGGARAGMDGQTWPDQQDGPSETRGTATDDAASRRSQQQSVQEASQARGVSPPEQGPNPSDAHSSRRFPFPRLEGLAPGWSGAVLPGATRPTVTPAGALRRRVSVGTEDLAEELAFKIASGVFDRDISAYLPAARFVVHLTYGGVWGLLFGLLQGSYRWPSVRFGSVFGLAMWFAGPATLAPSMRLMRPVEEEPPLHTALMVAGHVAYGVTLAKVFEALRPHARR
jgi:uncharacterized membrane protein YagU involved in acid resistance